MKEERKAKCRCTGELELSRQADVDFPKSTLDSHLYILRALRLQLREAVFHFEWSYDILQIAGRRFSDRNTIPRCQAT